MWTASFRWERIDNPLQDVHLSANLVREVFGEYEALRRGEEFHAPERRPFRNCIDWLSGQDFAAAERFWRRVPVS